MTATLLDVFNTVGIRRDDHIVIGHRLFAADNGMDCQIHTPASAAAAVRDLPANHECYFGMNPTTLPVGTTGRKGKAAEVARVVGLFADLDIKDGACPNIAAAHAIIDETSRSIGQRPAVIIFSGGGLQPVWAITGCTPEQGKPLARRFHRFVIMQGKGLYGSKFKLDTISNIDRVLRIPGTRNNKYDNPIDTHAELDTGRPMTVEEITAVLDRYSVSEMPGDSEALGDVVSGPDEWKFAGHTCNYAAKAIEGFATDTPSGGRHQHAVGKEVRLACMKRYGCLADQATLDDALRAIRERHAYLCATTEPKRPLRSSEIEDGWEWAVYEKVSRFTDERVKAELGAHEHQAPDNDFSGLKPEPDTDTDNGQNPETPPGGQDRQTPVLADALLTRSNLFDLPNPEPLIDDVLDQGTVALLYGKWGSGKSFIAQDWACSVATERPWQGRETEQRRVLYVAAEGAYGLKGRFHAWEAGWHTTIHDGALDILPRPVNLTNTADVHNLAALIAWGGYSFVILDTLARCMVGADENSAKDCGVVVDVLHKLREITLNGRGVVLGVHHTGKDGKTFRGSSAFEAGADTVYSVTLDDTVIVLDREKRKDGPPLDIHRLKLGPVPGTESVIIEVSRGVEPNGRGDKLLSHMRSHFAGRGAFSTQLLESSEMPKTTFYRALSDLLELGKLVNEGSDQRPFYKLAAK